jgi:S-layer homology domain
MVNFSMKMASTVTVATLLVTTLGSSVVSAASEFLPYAELLVTDGAISSQTTEAGYRLGATITRAELAKVAANLGSYTPTACTGVFADVTSTLGDLCGYVEALADAGIVASATNFRPTASVTRAEMTKMLVGVVGESGSATDAGYMDVATLGDLAMYINRANEMGCAADASYFRPNATASRGEAFKIAACVAGLDAPVTVPPTGTGTTGTGVVTPVAGAVSVALDGTAVAQYVPYNASSVKVGSIKLTAGAATTTVSSVVVTRSGLGDVAGIDTLQLAQSGVAISDVRTMSTSSQTSTLKFTTPLVLQAGTSASFDVLVNLKGSYPNNQHQFTVTAVNVANGTAAGTPVTLGLLNTTSYGVGTVAVTTLTPGSVTSGKTAQTVATTQILVNKDATLNGFTLTKSSGEDFTKVLANTKAYYNGAVVGTVTVTSDKITVTGLNIARLNGETANIEIKADGIYVGSAASIVFNIAQTTDVSATEKSTGYIMGVTGLLPAAVTLNLGAVDLTMTKVSTGSKTVAPGSSSVDLYNVNITSDATFDVSNYTLSMTGAANLSNFVDGKVTVYINGSDYEVTSLPKTFSATADMFRVEPGTTVNVRVVGNVKSTATTPTPYKFTLALNTAKNVSNGQTSTLVGKTLTSDTTTVNIGSYTVEKPSSIPAAKTVAEGSVSDMLYFNLRGSAENQVVKSVKVTSTVAFDTYATKIALMQGTTELKSTTNSTDLAGTSFDFTSLSQTITKDVTTPFTVRVTLKSGEVTTLGSAITLSLATTADVKVARSVDQNVATATTSTFPLAANAYQVSSNTPTVALTAQDGKMTTLVLGNVSNYDVVIESIKTEMTRNLVGNGGTYAVWSSNTPNFLDAVTNGAVVGTVAGTAPGVVTFTPSVKLTVGTGPVTRVIELVDTVNTVNDPDYTVTVKEVKFHYVDRTDSLKVSGSITETYNVAK